MRYYLIVITDPATGVVVRTYSSQTPQGGNNPAALNIEIDVPVTAYAIPIGAAFVRIWGISIREIGQASDLNGKNIAVYGGMAKGLPLANPTQAGLLVFGSIQQAFGNWQDVDMTLDIYFQPPIGLPSTPKNIVLNWTAGQPLAAAIKSTLAVAFPTLKATINISSNLVLPNTEPGFYHNLVEFAQYIKSLSRSILGGTYSGVDITIRQNEIVVYDGTSQSNPAQISFVDLIGQVTWIAPGQISFKTVMRADLNVGDYVKLPQGQVGTTAQSLSQFRQGSIFQGVFFLTLIRHVGNFRSSDAGYWVTTFEAAGPVPQQAAA